MSSLPDDSDIVLVDRYLDGALSQEQRRALAARVAADAGFTAWFCSEVRMQGQIAGLVGEQAPGEADGSALWRRIQAALDASGPDAARRLVAAVTDRPGAAAQRRGVPAAEQIGRRPSPIPRPSRPLSRARRPRAEARPWRWLGLAAALALGLLALVPLVRGRSHLSPGIPQLADWSGPVAVGGQALPSSPEATALASGARVAVGANGRAALRYEDGTLLELDAGTTVTLSAGDGGGDGGAGKRVLLSAGSLTATVAHQPSGAPMVLNTPDARAQVIGTRLTLAVSASGSRLSVAEGRVAFAALEQPQQVMEVAAGEVGELDHGRLRHRVEVPAPPPWAAAVAAEVPPRPQERAWQGIPWLSDLQQARRLAAADRRPLLLWVGWGDPLGMASRECLSDRQRLWSAPALARQAAGFVPVACDCWFLQRGGGADARFFARLVGQSPHPGADIQEGIYICTAAGRLLGYVSCGSDPAAVAEMLSTAAAAAQGLPLGDGGEELAQPAGSEPQPPRGALILSVFGRQLRRSGGGLLASAASAADGTDGARLPCAAQEVLWLSAPEWRSLIPADAHLGQHLAWPTALARKLACYALLDATQGEDTPWEPDDLVRLDLGLTVLEADAAQLLLRVDGRIELRDAGRSYAPLVEGQIAYDPVRDRITRCDLLALGPEQAAAAQPPVPAGALLGLVIGIAQPPDDAAHPHGARDPSYGTIGVPGR